MLYNKKILKFKCFKSREVLILRRKLRRLKVISSWSVENFLAVLLLFKISRRDLVESKPFKTSCEFIFFLIRIDFLQKDLITPPARRAWGSYKFASLDFSVFCFFRCQKLGCRSWVLPLCIAV